MKKILSMLLVLLLVVPVVSALAEDAFMDEQRYWNWFAGWQYEAYSYRWDNEKIGSPAEEAAIQHIQDARDEVEAIYWTLQLKKERGKYKGSLPSEEAFYELQNKIWALEDEEFMEYIQRLDTTKVGEGRELTAEELAMIPAELGTVSYARVYGETVHVVVELGGTKLSSKSEALREETLWEWDQEARRNACVGKNSSSLHCFLVKFQEFDAYCDRLEEIVEQLSNQLVASNAAKQEPGTVSLRAQMAAKEKIQAIDNEAINVGGMLYEKGIDFRIWTLHSGESRENIPDDRGVVEEGTLLYDLLYGEWNPDETYHYVYLMCLKEKGMYDGELPTPEEFLQLLEQSHGVAAQ